MTLAGLLGVFLLLLWWEARNGVVSAPPIAARPAAPEAFGERLGALWRTVFVDGWSPAVGGATLGVVDPALLRSTCPGA